jgi:hypothetical protein
MVKVLAMIIVLCGMGLLCLNPPRDWKSSLHNAACSARTEIGTITGKLTPDESCAFSQ